MGPAQTTAYLQGTALVQSQRLYITPGARDFGDVGVGETSAQLTFDVINEAAAAVLTATVEPSGTAFSIVSSDCAAATVPLHGTCSVTVQWAPGHGGAHVATLQLTGPGVGTWGAGLSGTSSRPLAITPTVGTMGSMLVGQSAPTTLRTFTIRNTAMATTAPLTPSFIGPAAASYDVQSTTCTTLAMDQECDVVVRLGSANATRGSKLAQLVVTDGTSTVDVRANLTGSVYTVLITGDETFPNTTSGQQSAVQMFTVINASDQPTGAIATTVGAQFSIASNTCAVGVTDHSSCTVGVRFAPSSAGAKSAALQLTATGAGGMDSITLTGTGQ
jgi:trimeric autotransporter adhesin